MSDLSEQASSHASSERMSNKLLAGDAEKGDRQSSVGTHRDSFTSYSRMLTFDATALRRNFTQTLAFTLGNGDVEWTKGLLESYFDAAKSGPDGDIPIPSAFAANPEFWKTFVLAAISGTFIGIVSLGFLNFADRVPRVWVNNWSISDSDDFFSCQPCTPTVTPLGIEPCESCDKYVNCGFYEGSPYWIGITTFTGFLVGIIRYAAAYPDNLPGLFREILSFHVEPKWAPYTVIISAISLGGGASLGPEQALSNLGGGLATYIKNNVIHFEDEDYAKLLVLAGISSAVGALFPTPLLAVLMLHELGEPPKSYMEATLIMSAGAIPAFLVYYAIVGESFIEPYTSNGAVLSFQWEFNEWNCGTAMVIGMVCAPLGLLIFLIVGVTKQIFARLRFRLNQNNRKFLAHVLPPVIAGVCVGAVNYSLPMTVGNGNMVISSIVKYGEQGLLSNDLLVYSALAKMFCLGICLNGGFVGGFIFPILTIAIMAGVLCHQLNEEVPLGLALGCFLSGLPSSVAPMPFTLSGLAIFVFYFGLYQTAPIFLSAIVSYTLVCGSGVFGRLLERGQKQTAELAQKTVELEKERQEAYRNSQFHQNSQEKEAVQDQASFAISNYKANTKKLKFSADE